MKIKPKSHIKFLPREGHWIQKSRKGYFTMERNERVVTEGNDFVLDLHEKLSEGEVSSEALVLEAQRMREAVSEARAVYEEKRSGIKDTTTNSKKNNKESTAAPRNIMNIYEIL